MRELGWGGVVWDGAGRRAGGRSVKKAERGGRKAARQSCGCEVGHTAPNNQKGAGGVGRDCVIA